jgi:hypothetical protein
MLWKGYYQDQFKEVRMVASINGSTTGIVPIPVAMVDAQTHIAAATGSDYESESG